MVGTTRGHEASSFVESHIWPELWSVDNELYSVETTAALPQSTSALWLRHILAGDRYTARWLLQNSSHTPHSGWRTQSHSWRRIPAVSETEQLGSIWGTRILDWGSQYRPAQLPRQSRQRGGRCKQAATKTEMNWSDSTGTGSGTSTTIAETSCRDLGDFTVISDETSTASCMCGTLLLVARYLGRTKMMASRSCPSRWFESSQDH